MAATGVEAAFQMLEGRWKMVIIFQLFAGDVLRFSELQRAIPGISEKMLIQQLRDLERDGIVARTVYPQVPPKVEYRLTPWGQAMCPALDGLLEWLKSDRIPNDSEVRRDLKRWVPEYQSQVRPKLSAVPPNRAAGD